MNNLIPHFIAKNCEKRNFRGTFQGAVMFADISGFTAITEALSVHGKEGAEILSNIINEVFSPCIEFIYQRGGFITDFIGDSWTAVFEKIDDAVPSSYQVLKEIEKQHIKKTKFGKYEISIKIGLSYGEIEWGIVGDQNYKTYYFKGHAVDGSSESEKRSGKMEIIMDESLVKYLDKRYSYEFISDGYYKLIDLKIIDKKSSFTESDIGADIQKTFLTKTMADNPPLAELRDIVSIFISFKGFDDYYALDGFCRDILINTVKWGGHFSRITFGDKGGTILINFGIPVSYENNIQRALNCISELHGMFDENFRAGITFGRLYCGYIGSSIRRAYDVLGDSVNLSARMAMRAPWGKIWISKNIEKYANKYYNTDFIDEFKFKGKAQIISVYELKDSKVNSIKSYKNSFYGREKEIKKLKDRISYIFNGMSAGMVYIYGHAGIGKSRILDEVTRNYKDSCYICFMQCDNILKKAWNPFVSYFNNYFEQNISKTSDEKAMRFENVYMKLISSLEAMNDERKYPIISEVNRTKPFIKALLALDTRGTLYEQLDPKIIYENTIYAIKELFRAFSLVKPLIIQIEDIQWIDGDSRILIKELMRNIENFPIIFLFTSRFNDDGSKPLCIENNKTMSLEIILENLSDSSAKKIIIDHLENEPDDELFEFIRGRTFNNPFFIEQFCLYLKENNLLFLRDKKLHIFKRLENIPVQINQILIARLDRLSSEIRELVKIASVIGKEFKSIILKKAVIAIYHTLQKDEKDIFDKYAIERMSGPRVEYYIKQAQKENIWDNTDEIGYIFNQSLLHETAYDMQLKERLRLLHRLVAQIMEEILLSEEIQNRNLYLDLAYHFEKAEIRKKTVLYLEKAGKYLQETFKNEEAIRIFEKLLVYLSNYQKILSTKITLGSIFLLICKWDEAEVIFKECVELAEAGNYIKESAISYCQLGVIARNKGHLKDALIHLEKSEELLKKIEDKKGLMNVCNYIGSVYYIQDSYDRALHYYNYSKNIAITEKINDGIMHTVNNIGLIYFNRGKYSEAMECFSLAREIAETEENKQDIALATINIGNVSIQQNKLDYAEECYHKCIEILKEIGDKQGLGLATVNLGFVLLHNKNYDESLKFNKEGLKIFSDIGDKRGMVFATNNIGEIYSIKKDYTESEKYYKLSMKLSKEIGNKQGEARAYNSLGTLYKVLGKYRKALNYFNKSLKLSKEIGDKKEIGVAYMNIASNYHIQGNLIKALQYYKLYKEESAEIKDIVVSTGHIGKIYYEMGNIDEAMLNIENAINILRENNFDNDYLKALLSLRSQIMNQINNKQS